VTSSQDDEPEPTSQRHEIAPDKRLSYFVTLVEERSFSAAAQRCGISQSALSQQIRKLEHELGAEFIDRSVQPFELTATGHGVYVRAREILEGYRSITSFVSEAAAGTVGEVRVGLVPSLLHLGTVPVKLHRYRRHFPGVRVTMHRLDHGDGVRALLDRRLDVLFTYSQVPVNRLKGTVVCHEPYVIALQSGDPRADADTIALRELKDQTFITFTRETYSDSQDDLILAARRAGFSPLVDDVYASFVEHTGFVAAGLGVALVPRSLSRYPVEGVSFVPLADESLELSTRMYWRPDANEPSVLSFLRQMVELFEAD